MALYKANRGRQEDLGRDGAKASPPEARAAGGQVGPGVGRGSLVRGRPRLAPSEAEAESAFVDAKVTDAVAPQEPMNEASEAAGEVGLLDLPLPSAKEPVPKETGRRVLGQTRLAARVPSHLQPYEETVVIGGDPRQPQELSVIEPSVPEPAVGAPIPSTVVHAPAIDKEILAKAEADAEVIRQQAQQEAQQFTAQVQAQIQEQAEQIRQQAHEQGYQEGIQAGMAAGQEQGRQESLLRIEQLKKEFVELVMARRQALASLEPDVVKLAVDIAEKIVGMELATGREIITGIVRQALATLKERDEVVIRVNPVEVDAIKAQQAGFEAMIEGLKRFEVIADGAIEAGSCSIETSLGNVDARMATQFEAVRAGLEEIAKIRSFEMKDKLTSEPVEVPGDPEFHARILQAEAEAREAEAAQKAHHE